jgi:hypothetical protein
VQGTLLVPAAAHAPADMCAVSRRGCEPCAARQAVAQSPAAAGRTSQLSQSARRSEAEALLQLACWMAETGQGARVEVSGALS